MHGLNPIHRALVALLTPLLLGFGLVACGGTVSGTPTVSLAGAVPWINTPAPPYQPPPTPPAGSRASDARPCTAKDVTAGLAGGNGAGGHTVSYLRFRNTSRSTCVLKGYPHVTATQPGHPDVVGTDGSFFPTPETANMPPGRHTLLGVETDTYCAARPGGAPSGPLYHHLHITLPGGGTVAVDEQSGGFDVSCGLHLTRFFVPQTAQPGVHDPISDLRVSLKVPPRVAAGSTLVYLADLTNPTTHAIGLRRCPGYLEYAGPPTPIKMRYALNCAPVGAIAAHATVRFEMRLPIPAGAAAGPLTFHWSLAGPFSVPAEATVYVTTPSSHTPGLTVTGVLQMTGGPAGAAPTNVPGSVDFHSVATGQSYPTTAAADGSFTVTVPPGQYTVTGTSPRFNRGKAPCGADGPVHVPASGLSGVVVACQRM